MNFDLKKTILDATAYVSGYVNDDDKYVISASMVNKEPLQNYLSIVHGKIHNEQIDDATLGSVFHRGMEEIINEIIDNTDTNFLVLNEHSMYKELPNNWVLSGTADLIVEQEPGHYQISDYKLSKMYALKMLNKDIQNHDYTKQLQVLEYLFKDEMRDYIIKPADLFVEFFAKDAKAALYEPTHTSVSIPHKIETSEMTPDEILVNEVVDITNSLQSYLESGKTPPKCADTCTRNVKGKLIQTKCQLYCSHGKLGLCPYFDPKSGKAIEALARW